MTAPTAPLVFIVEPAAGAIRRSGAGIGRGAEPPFRVS
jgi:hypothetical protein